MKYIAAIICGKKAFINKSGEQKLEIWSNRNKQIADPPFKPYFLSKRSLAFSNDQRINEELIDVRLLSTLKETKVFKYIVPNTDFIRDINKSLYKSNTTKAVFENKVPLLTRIMVDTPNFFNQYPNTNDLTFFYFDIETHFENHVDHKTITSIAYASNNREVYSHQGDEKKILKWFLS